MQLTSIGISSTGKWSILKLCKNMKKLLFLVLIALLCYVWIKEENSSAEFVTTITSAPTRDTTSLQQDTLMEIPRIGSSDVILRYSGFTVRYDTDRLIPVWVAYELTAEETEGDIPRANGFSMDLKFKKPQAMREDYSNSGWDKGHMAPAADMKWSHKAMYESFLLVNVCPQDHSMNSGPWLRLENWCRDKAKKYGRLYIVTGPIVDSCKFGTIGPQKVTVPDRFFKALLAKDDTIYRAIAFVMANDTSKQSIPKSYISIDSLEKLTRLDFFVNLPDSIENTVEAKTEYKEWANTKTRM